MAEVQTDESINHFSSVSEFVVVNDVIYALLMMVSGLLIFINDVIKNLLDFLIIIALSYLNTVSKGFGFVVTVRMGY